MRRCLLRRATQQNIFAPFWIKEIRIVDKRRHLCFYYFFFFFLRIGLAHVSFRPWANEEFCNVSSFARAFVTQWQRGMLYSGYYFVDICRNKEESKRFVIEGSPEWWSTVSITLFLNVDFGLYIVAFPEIDICKPKF